MSVDTQVRLVRLTGGQEATAVIFSRPSHTRQLHTMKKTIRVALYHMAYAQRWVVLPVVRCVMSCALLTRTTILVRHKLLTKATHGFVGVRSNPNKLY